MFLFPYGTNAPIYHWPITTVVLIAVNVLVFCVCVAQPPEVIEPYILQFGNGYHPLQWITCNFLHAGFFHLLGNMVFLWAFGLIVEGKLGWYKTLAVYLAIGAIECAIEQTFMLGHQGRPSGALGASGAIFGLMAMCLIWAPENDLSCFIVVVLLPFVRVAYFEMKVLVLVGLFLIFQIVVALLTQLTMSSEILHLVGAGVGFLAAILLLKLGVVDCEHWDIFSVIKGRHLMTRDEREEADAKAPARRREEEEDRQAMRESALEQIRQMIQRGDLIVALKAHEHMARRLPGSALPQPDMLALIQRLHEKRLFSESLPLGREYLSRYSQNATVVRLRFAHILLAELHRPGMALRVMAKVDEATLDARHRDYLQKLRVRAKDLHEQNPYELAEDM